MFKRQLGVFLIASSLLLPSLALSYEKGGPYLGFGAGIQNFHGYNGLYGNLFAGLNLTTAPFYWAAEVFADTGSIPISQKRFNRTTYGFGASFIPGLLLAQSSLVYLRVGVATFRYNKTNDYSPGGQLGIGLETKIATHWDIRGEYVYTGRGVIEGFGTSQFNFFTLALLYKF